MHRSTAELNGFLDHIRDAPADRGPVEMIVWRPAEDARVTADSGELDVELGLIGDNWSQREQPHPDGQLTLMNARVLEALTAQRDRWPLAGDQIVVDLDLSESNLPPGTRLRIGEATVEITAKPHTGCAKFAGRFGADGLRFVNVGDGPNGRFRGVYARVVEGGTFSVGDTVTKA